MLGDGAPSCCSRSKYHLIIESKSFQDRILVLVSFTVTGSYYPYCPIVITMLLAHAPEAVCNKVGHYRVM